MFFLHTTIVCCIESNERDERERGKDGNEKSWKVSVWIGVLKFPIFVLKTRVAQLLSRVVKMRCLPLARKPYNRPVTMHPVQ